MPRYQSSSSAETMRLGTELGQAILKRGPAKTATVVTLSGELGAGKTTFTKGLYKGLASSASVTSPTFIIIRHNRLPNPAAKKAGFKHIFHVDPYRLNDAAALKVLAFADLLKDPANVVIVEWPERAKGLLPAKTIKVALKHGSSEHRRQISITGL